MSGFIAATSGVQQIGLEDLRLNRMGFQPERMYADIYAIAPASFETPWWPKGGGFVGDGASDVGLLEAAWWGEYDQASGSSSRFGFTGVTRDANGTPVAAVTVKLFRTADDLLLDTQVSDTNGSFLLSTPYYPDIHYIYCHKTAAPDIDGVSVNTLIGS